MGYIINIGIDIAAFFFLYLGSEVLIHLSGQGYMCAWQTRQEILSADGKVLARRVRQVCGGATGADYDTVLVEPAGNSFGLLRRHMVFDALASAEEPSVNIAWRPDGSLEIRYPKGTVVQDERRSAAGVTIVYRAVMPREGD